MIHVLLVGSGAREDAIAHSLIKRSDVEVYAAMSSPNPGITRIAKNARVMRITDVPAVADYAIKTAS